MIEDGEFSDRFLSPSMRISGVHTNLVENISFTNVVHKYLPRNKNFASLGSRELIHRTLNGDIEVVE